MFLFTRSLISNTVFMLKLWLGFWESFEASRSMFVCLVSRNDLMLCYEFYFILSSDYYFSFINYKVWSNGFTSHVTGIWVNSSYYVRLFVGRDLYVLYRKRKQFQCHEWMLMYERIQLKCTDKTIRIWKRQKDIYKDTCKYSLIN